MITRQATWIRSAVAVAAVAFSAHAAAEITFYENDNFNGRSVTASRSTQSFDNLGFNDRASSVIVRSDRWEVCQDVDYNGRCVVLQPGRYASLRDMGLNDRISSVRRIPAAAHVADDRYARPGQQNADYSRRPGERTYEVPVRDVRAVAGTPEQRCWMEPGQTEHKANVPAGLAGAVIGGILGHQVGGGTGRDIATVGGAVAGGVVGSRINSRTETAPVQRCENVGAARPAYYDVTYDFRGQQHHVQMGQRPGRTITVNGNGEPRI